MDSTTFFIMRHGQTDWNLAGRSQGHIDIPLNTKGLEQARRMAQFLKNRQIELKAIYSSDLQRAHQTAQEIARLFSLDITLSADLREAYLGKIQGLTKQEVHDLYGPIDYEALAIPKIVEAEPRHQVVARLKKCLTFIAKKHTGQHIAIVTHGGGLRSLISHLGHSLEHVPAITNDSITTITCHVGQEDILLLESIQHV